MTEARFNGFIESCWERGASPKTLMLCCLNCRHGFTLQEETAGGAVRVLQDCACGQRRSILQDVRDAVL